MKQTITEAYFVDQIVGDEYNNMSMEGARALFEYLEDMEEDGGGEMEFDIVALRCEYSEYKNIAEIAHEYGMEEAATTTIEDIEDSTTVIEIPGTHRLIIRDF